MIKQDLNPYKKYFTEYTELRIQENRSEYIVVVDGDIMKNVSSAGSGVSARVFKNSSWGFASSSDYAKEHIIKAISSATSNAGFLDSRLKKQNKILPSRTGITENNFSTTKSRISPKEKINFIREIDAYIEKNYQDITSRTVLMDNLDMEKHIITADGSSMYSMIPRAYIRIILNMEKEGVPVSISEPIGGLGQFEDLFHTPEDLFKEIDTLYGHLRNKNEGIYPNAGTCDCILDADLAGMLAHEAIGHTTEADIVIGGSIAADYLEKKVASSMITMTDFAHEAFGVTCPVPVHMDDEGVKARDAVLIDQGVLKSFMHNKESSEHFGVKPTGNARAYEYSDEPLIRMRNTAIHPGKDSLDDMIASIKDGYYLMKTSNGQADSTSEFMFGITMGYEIKNGKLGKAIKDTTISGIAFDVLKTVTMISEDMSWTCSGFCGKKQIIPVGMGGPAIKCRVNIGGE